MMNQQPKPCAHCVQQLLTANRGHTANWLSPSSMHCIPTYACALLVVPNGVQHGYGAACIADGLLHVVGLVA